MSLLWSRFYWDQLADTTCTTWAETKIWQTKEDTKVAKPRVERDRDPPLREEERGVPLRGIYSGIPPRESFFPNSWYQLRVLVGVKRVTIPGRIVRVRTGGCRRRGVLHRVLRVRRPLLSG